MTEMENELNYTSLGVSQRLVASGIVLETNFYWIHDRLRDTWKIDILTPTIERTKDRWEFYPASSMAELWRELPEELDIPNCARYMELQVNKSGGLTTACYGNDNYERWEGEQESINPCDCLAKLLIWVRGREI